MGNEDLLRRHANGAGGRAARSAAGAPGRPSLRTVVVTCMDARIDVYTAFGLQPGEVHVLRSAGGVVTDDVVRSIAISQRKLGTTDVLLVHHSSCGMATFTDEEFSDELAVDCGARPRGARAPSVTPRPTCSGGSSGCAASRSCGPAPRFAVSCWT